MWIVDGFAIVYIRIIGLYVRVFCYARPVLFIYFLF